MSRFYWMYSAMLVGGAFLAATSGCPSLFTLPPTPLQLWGSLGAAVVFAAVVIGTGPPLLRVPWYRDMAALLKRMLTHDDLLGPELDASRALPIAAYSSLGEEAFFRGFIQPYLILKLSGWLGSAPGDPLPVLLGVAAASLLFGLVHFPVLRELRPWTLFAVLAGAGFGLLGAYSGSLLAPVLAHFLINWRNLVWLAKSELEPTDLEALFRGREGQD